MYGPSDFIYDSEASARSMYQQHRYQQRHQHQFQDCYDTHSIVSHQSPVPGCTRTIIVKEVPVIEPTVPQINRTYKITKTTTTTQHGVPPPPPPPLAATFDPDQIKQSFAQFQQQIHKAASSTTTRDDQYLNASGCLAGGAGVQTNRFYRSSSQFPEQPIHQTAGQNNSSMRSCHRSSSIPASQRTQFTCDDGNVVHATTVTDPNSNLTTTHYYTSRSYKNTGQDQHEHHMSNSRLAAASPQRHIIETKATVTEEFANRPFSSSQQQQILTGKQQKQQSSSHHETRTVNSNQAASSSSFKPISNHNHQSSCIDYNNSYFNTEYGSGGIGPNIGKHIVIDNETEDDEMMIDHQRITPINTHTPTTLPIIQQGQQSNNKSSAFSSNKSKVKQR